MQLVLALLGIVVLPPSTTSHSIPSLRSESSGQCDFTPLHPRRYAAYHLPTDSHSRISIDGVLDENVWTDVPWSQAFVDIRGPTFWSQPWFVTKCKLRYDQTFLYIGAYLEETTVWANLSHRNDVIFHDNDFEVFVDPDGTTHNYKEFELNARNATWNLWLNRPYRDGGHENSTRVDPEHGFDMVRHGMRSAVFVKGQVNDPSEQLHYWTAEIALPLSQLAYHSTAVVPPRPLSFWRINFSRVEWPVRVVVDRDTGRQRYEKPSGRHEENWVWSSQFAVNMHRPEWWGYLHFRPQGEPIARPSTVPLDPEWSVRFLSFQYYYAQHAFHEATGTYASRLERLEPYFVHRDAYPCIQLLEHQAGPTAFHAKITAQDATSAYVASIRDDGYIVVRKASTEERKPKSGNVDRDTDF
ncbi:hypothetical protein PsorP6_009180 [Peronosclerospora sorghi]|uniref:Uncharacterized protein n=1 Tax=Peronosclerospora sorghi TaxID=230839 RepID=A0ACC0W1J8_9STRA|nr:hypothetical protein PsorP6_009180 [Peronosclerospora sorghi]